MVLKRLKVGFKKVFDVLILCAGRGSRMRHLTDNVAKPALSLGSEKIVARLVKQVSNMKQVNHIFVNCSYQAFSIVDALKTTSLGLRLNFLWEREYMGTGWSVTSVHEEVHNDVLVIHGDLLLSTSGLTTFIESETQFKNYSLMAFHRRSASQARSILELESDGLTIRKFFSSPLSPLDSLRNQSPTEIFSNSGIYLFRSRHLDLFDRDELCGKDIVTSIIPKLVAKRFLAGHEFLGQRLSIETAHDLQFAQENISQFN